MRAHPSAVPAAMEFTERRKWSRLEQSGSWEMREDLDTAAGLPSAQQKVLAEAEHAPGSCGMFV